MKKTILTIIIASSCVGTTQPGPFTEVVKGAKNCVTARPALSAGITGTGIGIGYAATQERIRNGAGNTAMGLALIAGGSCTTVFAAAGPILLATTSAMRASSNRLPWHHRTLSACAAATGLATVLFTDFCPIVANLGIAEGNAGCRYLKKAYGNFRGLDDKDEQPILDELKKAVKNYQG